LRYPGLCLNATLEFDDQLFIHRNNCLPSYINEHIIFHFNCKYNYGYKCDNNINILELYEYDLDNTHNNILLDQLHGYSDKSRHEHRHNSNNDDNIVNIHELGNCEGYQPHSIMPDRIRDER